MKVRRVDAATGVITTIAGTGFPGGNNGTGGPATSHQLNAPNGVALDALGNVYIADAGNGRIVMVEAASGRLLLVAGGLVGGFNGDNRPAIGAFLTSPSGVAVDAFGNLYIGDSGNARIRKVSPGADGVVNGGADEIITTVAGNGVAVSSGDFGPATQASLGEPRALDFDPAGNLYVIDRSGSTRIRRIVAGADAVVNGGADEFITTVAGGGGGAGESGAATDVALGSSTFGIAIDFADIGSDNLFIAASTPLFRVYKVVLATGAISRYAGNGIRAYAGDGGPALDASFSNLEGLAVFGAKLYVSDGGNDRIRVITAGAADYTLSGSTQTTLDASGLVNVSGNLTVSGNANLTSVDVTNLITVGGSFTVSDNPALTSVDAPSLVTVAGDVTVSNNPALTIVSLPNLSSAGGDVAVSGNASATSVSLPSITSVGGDATVTNNGSATVTLGTPGTTTTVGGNLTLETTTCAPATDLTHLVVSGNTDLTLVNSCASGTVSLVAATSAVNPATATVTGSTTVTLENAEATMTAFLRPGAFTSRVTFSISHLDPATLPPSRA